MRQNFSRLTPFFSVLLFSAALLYARDARGNGVVAAHSTQFIASATSFTGQGRGHANPPTPPSKPNTPPSGANSAKPNTPPPDKGPMTPQQHLTAQTKLADKLQTLIPGTPVLTAADTFTNFGQFVAAVHVSHNL